MSSKVQICNTSLTLIGGQTFVAFTDLTAESIACDVLFDDLADIAMTQGSWSTTIKRATLARTTNTPEFDYTYEFQLPVDPKCLKVLNINGNTEGETEYSIEGDKLLIDYDSVKIRYISQLTDTQSYGTLLTEALKILLASHLAIPVAGDKTLAKDLLATYEGLVEKNLALDGQQGSNQIIVSNDLTRVR